MSSNIQSMRYEFFSIKGSIAGAAVTTVALIFQAYISFPQAWVEQPFRYAIFIISSAFVVAIASGSVLVFLFPPDQDVIGLAGLGSDEITQHIALFLVMLSLIEPILAGFVFFYGYFGTDPFIFIWVIVGFAAPSAGFSASMFDRTSAIAKDLEAYFSNNATLELTSLEWLHGVGPRTAVYRMGMLESAASKVPGLRVRGHLIVKVADHLIMPE
ncbi:MAG: hypothetical protein ACFFEJ_19145 [Candidatus Thorarchaeota archaeon]